MSGLSRRELEHKKLLDQIENETPEGSGATTSASTTYANNVGVLRNRDRANQEEFAATTDPTPEGRKSAWNKSVAEENERLNKLGAEARARNERIRQEAERVKQQHAYEQERMAERRREFTQSIIDNSIKSEIKAIMCPDNLDILDECRILVEEWRMPKSADAWRTAVKTVRSRAK